jgi:SAM-dependent methyltransferase
VESYYGNPEVHLLMIRDDIRNRAYRDALQAAIKPGDLVLDFGAGTGILSMFAAQAGAKRVFAVERTNIASFARRITAQNGFADRIQIIQQDIEKVRLPQKVDVIVSEWLGTYGVDENLLAPLLLARDRWLKPGGKMLPESVSAWLSPLWNSDLAIDVALSRGRPYGLDLRMIANGTVQEMNWARKPLSESDLMAHPQIMWTTDVYSCSVSQARLPSRAQSKFLALRDGKINALSAWFTADFGNSVTLTNSPAAPVTHWGQYLFALKQPVEVTTGTPIFVEFTCLPATPGYTSQAWSVRVGDGPWEHHDTRTSILH